DPENGMMDLGDLESKITERTACVYFENPNYLGVIEAEGAAASELAHDHGAESVCGVDPISLGVLAPPSEYGVDIACGEAQPLGVHMYAGGGSCGFITSRDEERYVAEYPLRLVCIAETAVEGEYGFGQAMYDRTSYMARENAKDWVGTTTALWGIVAAVYMSLLGPSGMRELGETILQKSHYAAALIDEVTGASVPFKGFFKEFPVTFRKPVNTVNEALLRRRILGGNDLSDEYPELGDAALYCVTETHSLDQLLQLESALREDLA
ncbi:aminomethyl-transferring glycine dehydrogenase, partial [Candidatus Bathyarchaeota archaeon]|nr:aminomethyl-transferring glycine dehydrogenase [Candidatus Bathyarchaeota archaeon]